VTEDEAAWVRQVVLAKWGPRSWGRTWETLIRVCPCQYGPCGWCKDLGKHERCTHKVAPPHRSPAARLSGIPVWALPGPACSWRCPCPVCAKQDVAWSIPRRVPRMKAASHPLTLF